MARTVGQLATGRYGGRAGLCLDPQDLAIAKYGAARKKDLQFNRQLVGRGLLDREKLLQLLQLISIDEQTRSRVAQAIALDFSGKKT